jgi:hypothetical protein
MFKINPVYNCQKYFQGFRNVIARLGVQVSLELHSVYSVLMPYALDVTVRMFAGTFADPYASQYLLCKHWLPKLTTAYGVEFRKSILDRDAWQPHPWHWYHFPVWQSMGQTLAREYIAMRFRAEDRIALDVAITDSLDDT